MNNSGYNCGMDKSDTFILVMAGIVGGIFLFSGFITTIAKSFSTVPDTEPVISEYDEDAQRERMQEIKEKQRRHMEDQKRRIKDLQRL